MRVSFFPTKYSPAPQAEEISWDDLIAALYPHVIGPKDDQALFSPAEWTPGSEQRTKANVLSVHFGVLDFDHLTDDKSHRLSQVLATIPEAWILYSTYSHGENGEGALRLVVPFTRPVQRADWPQIWPRLVARFGNLADQSCKDQGRIFYVPTAAPERAHLAVFHAHEGPPLDVDELATELVPIQAAIEQRTEPVNRTALKGLLSKLRRKRSPIAEPFAAVLDGEPWAPKGQRDTVLFSIAGAIASEFPRADMSTIVNEFAGSVQRILLDDPSTHVSLDVVLDKLIRRQVEIIEEEQAKEIDSVREKQSRIRQAFKDGRTDPYTEEELQHFADQALVSRYDFRKRWIVQVSSSFYFFLGGKYHGPYPKDSAQGAARVLLAPASSGGVELDTRTLTGGLAPKSIDALALDYGTVARRIVGDMMAQATWYDPSEDTVIEATCPVRNVRAIYHEKIARWLDILGGKEQDNLRLWLSYVLDLDLACAALYLEGPPGCGKSLLAKGIARLWKQGPPTTLDQAMGNFNSAVSDCPLVFADETMPVDFRGRARTAELRAFIQEEARPWKRKHIADGVLRGACRVMVAANNRNLIQGEESLTAHDVEAIAGRILHVHAGRAATLHLEASDTRGWVSEDKIAEHVAWLWAHTLKPAIPPRFLIPRSEETGIQRAIVVNTAMGSAVCHWLVSFILDPNKLRSGTSAESSAHMARVFEGILAVNVRVLVEHWERYCTNVDKLRVTPHTVGRVLSAISTDKIQRGAVNYHLIDPATLVEWAESNGYTDRETICERLSKWRDA